MAKSSFGKGGLTNTRVGKAHVTPAPGDGGAKGQVYAHPGATKKPPSVFTSKRKPY